MTADPAAALREITAVLSRLEIPFRVTGGLAANAYGSARPLADIDLDLPDAAIEVLAAQWRDHILWGPGRHRSDDWDLLLCTISLHGQEIDLCGAESARYRERATGQWHADGFDHSEFEVHRLFGLDVPVVPRAVLVGYKRRLARPVDLADVAALEF